MDKKILIKNLAKRINFSKININLIKKNSKKIFILYKKIKQIWDTLEINIDLIELDKSSTEYKKIYNLLNGCILNEYKTFNNFIKNAVNIIKFRYENITYYYNYINIKTYQSDIPLIRKMIKEIITLQKYFDCKHNVTVLWIPINTCRDYKDNLINSDKLKRANDKFKAFTASGLTFDFNKSRCTIVSRYEEVEKLLFHELVHNFYIDGSNYHNNLHHILDKYEKIKKNKSNNENFHYIYSIYESYTELMSSYLNIIFYNIINNPTINDKDIIIKIESQIIIELLYSYNTISNLIKLNNYNSWIEFKSNNYFFMGNICFYEYYLIKGLLYNHFKFNIVNTIKDFKNLYDEIITIIQKNINYELLIDVFNNHIEQKNFKYILINI